MLNLEKILESWQLKDYRTNPNCSILKWIFTLNSSTKVAIKKCSFDNCVGWHYDVKSGSIINNRNSFFKISGFEGSIDNNFVEQPIIIQDEIGYLGIICAIVDGVLQFLMQAKIEPGNVNKIQISPTIQATKSNFTQVHGGRRPNYLDYFLYENSSYVLFDQIQSEQGGRFFKKRNRNIIIFIEKPINVLPNFKWMTLGQIKEMMSYENLVNMDTRTVISCLPIIFENNNTASFRKFFNNAGLFNSFFGNLQPDFAKITSIFQYINNYKMFSKNTYNLKPLFELGDWKYDGHEIKNINKYFFKVIFCEIEIEGREVKNWCQPLFEACGQSLFGLMICDDNGVSKFVVRCKPEIGCFDKIEIGPTIQLDPGDKFDEACIIDKVFENNMLKKTNILRDCVLSEEGGRFYCEENRNILMHVDLKQISPLPAGYFLLDYLTLNFLIRFNNILNIQLRNLISMVQL